MAVVEVAVQIEIEATVLHSEHSLDARSARPLWNDALVARTRRYRIVLPLSETPSNDAADSSSGELTMALSKMVKSGSTKRIERTVSGSPVTRAKHAAIACRSDRRKAIVT